MGSNAPVLLVIEDALDDLHRVGEALQRRFGSDFGVITSSTAGEGTEMLERLARDGAPVALVAVGLRTVTEAVDVLRRVRALHPGARRALFLPMSAAAAHGPGMDAILRAMALGELDFSILKGWVSPEEWLYPQVQEALSEWVNAHRPRHEHFQIVGDQWSPRSHDLRDILTRNHVPFGFYAADSDAGRQLLAGHGVEAAQLPVVITFDGPAL